jgi:hypothetical protein
MAKKPAAKDTAQPALIRMFVPITRVEEIDDETCEVVGIATSEAVDSYGTIFDFEASKKAYERWADAFSRMTDGESKGNVREMHQKSAVGKVLEWKPNEADRSIEIRTRIVGKDPVRKCRERIYTGFSHGVWPNTPPRKEQVDGKIVERYSDFDVREVSLADSPSNPESLFLIVRLAEDGTTVTPLEAAIAAVPPRRRAPADPVEEAAPVTPAAATPEVPAAAPAIPAPEAAAIPAPAPVATTTPTVTPTVPEVARLRVPVALDFDPAKFTPEQAREWALGHQFRARGIVPPGEGQASLRVLQHGGDPVITEAKQLRLADGVTLVTAELKEGTPQAHLAGLLRTHAAAILERVRSQGGSIMASLNALASLVQAIDTAMYGGYSGEAATEQDRAAVATLTGAAESILDFCADAFRTQLVSMGTEAQRVATSDLERFTQLPKVLTPAQLQRVMDDSELLSNVSAMHGIGHALCDATMQMGGACEGNRCERVNDGEEAQPNPPETDEPDNNGGTPPPKKEEQAAAAEEKKKTTQRVAAPIPAPPAAPAPAPVAPAPPIERTAIGTDQVLQALGKQVEEQVTAALSRLIEPIDTRLRQVESAPTRIGRPPAAPVEKVIAGSRTDSPTSVDDAATLQRLAESETDPAQKAALLRRAATETIRAAQIAGRS